MGTCIICGTSVDGHICSSHEEDVAFTFTGDRPGQLTVGRFYEGTVDGVAEFGVFVTIGDSVTGLLHRSELPMRLESIDWEEGDRVFTQVLGIHDNGNIDLGWSIRQSTEEFRGALIQTPDGDRMADVTEPDGEEVASAAATPNGGEASASNSITITTRSTDTETEAGSDTEAESSDEGPAEPSATQLPERVPVESLSDRVGTRVTVEGRLVAVRQTSGPTVFKVRDETGVVTCAGFEGAGVRAYPEIDVGDVVRLFGEVERRHGDLQVEIEAMEVLSETEAEAVLDRVDDVIDRRAEPDRVDLLADHGPVEDQLDAIRAAATAIRRAVISTRPIVVRHTATADGYVAGAALERAVLPLIREEHDRDDAEYRYFDRRPLDRNAYDMRAATPDVTRMLDHRERHGEKLPLVVLLDTGTTDESIDGFDFLDVYGVRPIAINAGPIDRDIEDRLETVVQTDHHTVTTTVLAATVAAAINPDVRGDIRHLPGVSYWDSPPEQYHDLAVEADYDADDLRELREAVALEAYYQAYEDKRELIADLLFKREEGVRGLASHISEQFRIKLDAELETVRPHVEHHEIDGVSIALLDTDAYTHRYDFPPKPLLLDALHRTLRDREDANPHVTIGLADSEAIVRSTDRLAIDTLADGIRDALPEADISVVTARKGGRIDFLIGQRDAVRSALLEAVAPAIEP